ncbi:hypothetical protein BGX38DRAFT_1335247 [Terfezia claveryi]|nr:hypothetical protein BGX38DRAFT_1335247 [Terfezia claveryi]
MGGVFRTWKENTGKGSKVVAFPRETKRRFEDDDLQENLPTYRQPDSKVKTASSCKATPSLENPNCVKELQGDYRIINPEFQVFGDDICRLLLLTWRFAELRNNIGTEFDSSDDEEAQRKRGAGDTGAILVTTLQEERSQLCCHRRLSQSTVTDVPVGRRIWEPTLWGKKLLQTLILWY